jgi:hypothetical protein
MVKSEEVIESTSKAKGIVNLKLKRDLSKDGRNAHTNRKGKGQTFNEIPYGHNMYLRFGTFELHFEE